ncbi:hypothetical protein [Arthrobacter woluwensis]|uniref:hypothetical protein n=1 Tax=Arthrobacter woluwensis TaxID=156980 RepID=UPI0011A8CA3B|nr:hypothetical protein [Arthrobacter woluwensis]
MRARVKLNNRGFKELRNDPAVVEFLEDLAERVIDNAGPGFDRDTHTGGTRARVAIFPNSAEGYRAEAKYGALSKAVGGG